MSTFTIASWTLVAVLLGAVSSASVKPAKHGHSNLGLPGHPAHHNGTAPISNPNNRPSDAPNRPGHFHPARPSNANSTTNPGHHAGAPAPPHANGSAVARPVAPPARPGKPNHSASADSHHRPHGDHHAKPQKHHSHPAHHGGHREQEFYPAAFPVFFSYLVPAYPAFHGGHGRPHGRPHHGRPQRPESSESKESEESAESSEEVTTVAPPTPAPSSTAAPTTVAPTTVAPTTVLATTEAATTQAPTTVEATTTAPTTEAATTEAPTTPEPTTEAPTTAAPTTEAPTTEAETTTEAATTPAPTTEAPTTPAPTTEAPTTEAPTTQPPTTEAPTTVAPTTPAPTTEAPATAAPATGTVSGLITNAITGEPEPGSTITFRSGANAKSGAGVATATGGADGSYTASLPAGEYTAEVSKNGFVTSYITVIAVAGQDKPNQQGVISPVLADGETRIVLTWGEFPYDLDTHMTGPQADGSRFHVSYMNRGSSSAAPFTVLDVDDTQSYGPETLTVEKQLPGVYTYSVHDYSDLSLTSSTKLAESSAKVQIIRGSTVLNTFTVPTGQPGTLWTVFQMNGATVTPVNTMSYQNNPSAVL